MQITNTSEIEIVMLEGAAATLLIAMLDIPLDLTVAGIACGFCGKTKMHCIILTGAIPRIYLLAPRSNQQQIQAFMRVAKRALQEIDRMNSCGNN